MGSQLGLCGITRSRALRQLPSFASSPVPVLSVLLNATRLARQCVDCEVQYWTCSWNCYQEWGYQPICADLISYKTGSAEEVEVFPNQCIAGCYVKAYEEFYAIKGFEPKFEQVGDASCDAAWKREQALDYEYFSSPDSFKYAGLLPAEENLPQWLQDELANVKGSPNPADDLELPLKLEECSVCRAGRDISGKAVILQADGALAPAGAIEIPDSTDGSPAEALLPSGLPAVVPGRRPHRHPGRRPGRRARARTSQTRRDPICRGRRSGGLDVGRFNVGRLPSFLRIFCLGFDSRNGLIFLPSICK